MYVVRVIKQCCFNSVPDHFNGQTVNFFLKPPKVTVWALKGSGTLLTLLILTLIIYTAGQPLKTLK